MLTDPIRLALDELINDIGLPREALIKSVSGTFEDQSSEFNMRLSIGGYRQNIDFVVNRTNGFWKAEAQAIHHRILFILNLNSEIEKVAPMLYHFHRKGTAANDTWLYVDVLWSAVFPLVNATYVYDSRAIVTQEAAPPNTQHFDKIVRARLP
jgi:hypothetical protein